MVPEMIPMMIQQGYKAIAVAFDMWGLANVVNSGIQKGREFARQAGDAKTNGNGKAP